MTEFDTQDITSFSETSQKKKKKNAENYEPEQN